MSTALYCKCLHSPCHTISKCTAIYNGTTSWGSGPGQLIKPLDITVGDNKLRICMYVCNMDSSHKASFSCDLVVKEKTRSIQTCCSSHH